MDFHVAVYRKSHDADYGRAWISIDGQQIGSWSCFEQLFHGAAVEQLRQRFPGGWFIAEYNRLASERGVYSQKEFKRLLAEYLDLDPHVALTSAIPLTRALAVIDKRVGRRSLARFAIAEEPDVIVQLLYHLRTQKSQPCASPNGGPATPVGNSGVVKGRHR